MGTIAICLLFVLLIFPLAAVMGRIFIGKHTEIHTVGLPILVGLIMLISLLASIVTCGKTVFLPVALFFCYQLLVNRKVLLQILRLDSLIKEILPIVLLSWVTILSLAFFTVIPLGSNHYLSPDYIFYGKLGNYLMETGFETKNLNYYRLQDNYTEVYHYFDIWLFGLFRKLSGLSSNQSVFAVSFFIFVPLIFQNLLDVCNRFVQRKTNWILALLLLIPLIQISGSNYLFDLLFGKNEYADFTGLGYPKLLIIYVFFLCLVQQLQTTGHRMVVWLICLFTVSYTPVFPAYFGILAFWYFYQFKRTIFRKENLLILLPFISLMIYVAIYYFLFSSKDPAVAVFKSDTATGLNLRTRINIVGKTGIYILVSMLPLLLVLFIKKDTFLKALKRIGLIGLAGVFCGLFAWALIYSKTDSVQLWSNFYFPFVGSIYTIGLIYLVLNKKYVKSSILGAFILVDLFVPKFEIPALKPVVSQVSQFKMFNQKKVAFFGAYDYTGNIYLKNDAVYFGQLYELVSFSEPKLISFSSVEIKPLDDAYESVIRQSHLFQLRPFPIGKPETQLVAYQDSMFSELEIEYVVVNKSRKMPLVLERWNLKKLPVEDKEVIYYKLLNRRKIHGKAHQI